MQTDQRVKILELLADGGALTVFTRSVEGEWPYTIEVNETMLEDEDSGFSDRPVRTWEDVLAWLEHYHWRKLHLHFVHPAFAERIEAARRDVRSRPRRNDGMRRAVKTFTEAGLPVPPIPKRFAGELRRVEPWCFSTRDVGGIDMNMFDQMVYEGVSGSAPDYLAFSHAGHGANSYAINYFLVDGPLALFAQTLWGGAYCDLQESTADVARLFERCAALIEAMGKAVAEEPRLGGGRLVVVESEMRFVRAWGWIDGPLAGRQAAREWLEAHSAPHDRPADPIEAAVEWLNNGFVRQEPLF